MPPKTNYDYYMKKPEIRRKWEENEKNGKIINPITDNELTSKAEGSVYYFLEKAYNKYKESTHQATSPKQSATSRRTQSRKPPGTVLNKAQIDIKQFLNDKLNSFTSESTYEELKKLLEDLIDLKEVFNTYLNREKYNPPYYGKNGIQQWIEKMREPQYQKRYMFYDLAGNKDLIIYNNYNFYFKTIMFAFVYGLLDSDEIPESLSKDSINGDIPSKFIELLKLVFQKYNFEELNEKETREPSGFVSYYRNNSKYNAMEKCLEEFKYLKYFQAEPISSKQLDVYKENRTNYFYQNIKINIIEIDMYLKKTLLKYNKKFQLSNNGKEFKTFLETIKSQPPPKLYNRYS